MRRDFIFESFWLQDKECPTVIADSWASLSQNDSTLTRKLQVSQNDSTLTRKLQVASSALARWSKSKFFKGHHQISLLKQQIQSYINQLSGHYDKAQVNRLKDEVQHF